MAQTKGYMWGRKSKLKLAKIAILKAGKNAYRDRRRKKRTMRRLWQTRVNAAARENGISYSKLIGALKKSGIVLDRKILSQLAMLYPEVFKAVVAKTGK